jgi:hypothetical protein
MPCEIKLILEFLLVFSLAEAISLGIFHFVRKALTPGVQHTNFSTLMGIFERLMLTLGFIANIPTVFVFFGALKLGSKIKGSSEENIPNDYFLIGNAVSAIIAILEFFAFNLISKHF